MTARKRFDCVEMKNAIQARLLDQREGLAEEEIEQQIAELLATSGDPLARKWRRIGQLQRQGSRDR